EELNVGQSSSFDASYFGLVDKDESDDEDEDLVEKLISEPDPISPTASPRIENEDIGSDFEGGDGDPLIPSPIPSPAKKRRYSGDHYVESTFFTEVDTKGKRKAPGRPSKVAINHKEVEHLSPRKTRRTKHHEELVFTNEGTLMSRSSPSQDLVPLDEDEEPLAIKKTTARPKPIPFFTTSKPSGPSKLKVLPTTKPKPLITGPFSNLLYNLIRAVKTVKLSAKSREEAKSAVFGHD
ncbi:hypothetical protein FRB99_000689, partial [Tulasnella sp. 403]